MPAIAATTITGSVSDIAAHESGSGLIIAASGLNFGPFTLNAAGDTFTTAVLQIGSPENSITWFEDTRPYDIAVSFSFTDPDGASGPAITGETRGRFFYLGDNGGRVEWDSHPQTYSFGPNGDGAFTIALQDTIFKINGGSTNVLGTFALVSDATPAVPEPATWGLMILGFGLIGAAVRRRNVRTTVRFA